LTVNILTVFLTIDPGREKIDRDSGSGIGSLQTQQSLNTVKPSTVKTTVKMSLLKLNNYIKDECKDLIENLSGGFIFDEDNLLRCSEETQFFYYFTEVTRFIGNDLQTWIHIQTEVVEQDLEVDYSDFTAIANQYARGMSMEILIKLREDLWKEMKNALNEKVPETVTDLIFGFLPKPHARYNYDRYCIEWRSLFNKNKWVAAGDPTDSDSD
jgi:hypothetical protein